MLYELTNVLPERQKLVGFKLSKTGKALFKAQNKSISAKLLPDDTELSMLLIKPKSRFMMIGTPEEQIFVDVDGAGDDVINDLDVDYSVAELDLVQHDPDHIRLLERHIRLLKINLINPLRPGKKLLVLDIDYCIYDMKGQSPNLNDLKRPFTDELLEAVYPYYDLVFWSQTSWRALEAKLTEMGLLTSPKFKVAFVLDKTCMFRVQSPRPKDGTLRRHQVKALPLIWAKFKQFSAKNTIHIDDLGRNFAMNPQSGLKIKAYKNSHKNKHRDKELLFLTQYLLLLAQHEDDFTKLDHAQWKEYIAKRAQGQ